MAERVFGTTETVGGEVPLTASIAEVLEDKAAHVEGYVDEWAETADDLIDEGAGFASAVGSFFRRHPVMAVVGTIAAGYAISRLRRRY